MDPITQQTVTAAAGAGGGDPLYVDDVFSTYLYDGTGSAQTITNGIDISGEGGLVWIKNRESGTQDNVLNDTERGAGQIIESNNTNAQFLSTARFSAFNSNGFTVGTDNATNQSGNGIVSWTFRKAPGFFDVVTWTGNGTAGRTISHSLGSVPGMIIVKKTSGSDNWQVWHRSISTGNLSGNDLLKLDGDNGKINRNSYIGTVNSSTFEVGTDSAVNINGSTYVAYIFAHDDAQFGTGGDESIIKCGTFEGNVGTVVNLGFEPQWILVKRVDGARDWFIYDTMRGLPGSDNANTLSLSPNLSAAENDARSIHITSTGFKVSTSTGLNSDTHIYIAIRRPHKPPEAGTDVFAIDTLNGTSPSPPGWTSGFVVDWKFQKTTTNTSDWETLERITGGKLYLNRTDAEVTPGSNDTLDYNNGWGSYTAINPVNYSWMFRRAPGFFDMVAYTGTGSARTVDHNLAVTPELMIVKRRNDVSSWITYSKTLGNNKWLALNDNNSELVSTDMWNATDPTSTVFSLGGVGAGTNISSSQYIAYLFATLPGISKVGSYTGTGSPINIDCGFTNGARFVLIKRTDAAGGWYLWDTTQGIVSGNDPYLRLDITGAQTTSTDHVDPLNAGFIVNANETDLNASGGTYIFLAIA